jgi:two-component system response regulator AtoC
VRELEHVIEQATVTTPGPVIEPENLPAHIVPTQDEPFHLEFDHRRPLPEITAEFTIRIERAYLERILQKYRGRIELCARHCGLSRRSISEKLRRYQIDKRDYKSHSSRRRHLALASE